MEDILVHRFGRPGAHPRIYLQAGLHADEVAGTLVLDRLARLLEAEERHGRIAGEIVVVPHCNPAGLGQFVLGRHLGRFDLRDGRNFNRGFPDIADEVIAALDGLDKDDLTHARVVEIGRSILDAARPANAGDRLRAHLLKLSFGADIVVDVHSDMEAILHLYSSQASWPGVKALAGRLAVPVVMLTDVSANSPFDEANSNAWCKIQDYLRQHGAQLRPVSSCTVELRGLADVGEALAERDASAFHAFLIDAGAIRADSPVMPADTIRPIALEAVEMMPSPCSGVLVPLKAPGDRVRKGDVLARILDPASRGWTDIVSPVDGLVFARWHQRVIERGMSVCKIAADHAPERRAARLLD